MNRKLFLSLAAAVLCSLSFFIFGGVRKTSAAGPAEIWIQIGDPNWVTKLESALLDPDCAEIVLGDGEFVFTETIKISLAAEAGVSKTLRSENSNTSVKAGVFANGFSYFLDITYPAEEFSLTVRGIDFEGNYTADDFPPQENAGGGISVAFGSAGGQNFAVENCSFRDFQKGDTSNFPNTPGDGAALKITTVYDTGRVSGNAAEISGCRFINNVTAYAEVYSGAAIAMISKPGLSDFPAGTCASLTVKDTQFINNGNLSGANINGGAVYAADCAVRIDRSEFTGNSTRGKGGAVYLQNCIDSYIADTTVYGNEGKTNNSGAAVYAYDSQMWLIGSTVTANTCVGNRSDNYKTAGVYHEQKNRNAKLTVVASVIQNNFAFFTESGEQGWYENNIGSDNFVEFNCSPAFNIGANGTELEVYASGNELFASYEEKELVDAYSAFPVFVPALAVAAGRSYAPLSEAAAGLELELLRAYVETLGGSGLFGIDAPGRKDQLGNPRYTKIDGTSYIDPGAVQRQPARQIYTVTFDLSGAEGTEPASVTNYEGEVVDLPDMTELAPTHYTFGGWSETSGGGAIEGTYLMPDGGTTLYAIWVEDTKYTVTFDLSGAEGVAPQSVTDYAGETVQLSDGTGFTREHYTFGGWSETTGGAVIVGTYYMPEGGVVLYAVWIEDKGGDGPGGEEPGENVPGGDEGDDKPGENESGGDESGCGGSGAAANAVLFLGAALLALKKRYK